MNERNGHEMGTIAEQIVGIDQSPNGEDEKAEEKGSGQILKIRE